MNAHPAKPADVQARTEQPKIKPRAEHTITRADLSNAVYGVIGTTRTEAAELVDFMFDKMFETICSGETVKLHNFGKFVIRQKDKREGRNPRTLEPAEISERRIVQFKPSPAMKQRLNKTNDKSIKKSNASPTTKKTEKIRQPA